ncbi:hypothetical protein Lepto7376_0748 [[Leptolyngbya] sp. PCC 7376]|uniref:PTPA-CTERM sorting domain-containing protein n=1 Tax=[Leptolyngbya] sp. PCC 7376 TaxID=111781 RepID=UPI00029F27A3|nr:PTPA-CTERM sorting domain-containing protein [[Leptolyngbya] sp. PCC 7376]AFY37146.1 hypothetical protein Lepto7376_0748 [[Leptolyngbya] sp. PCC 7376]
MNKKLLLGAIATSVLSATAVMVAPSANAMVMQLGTFDGNDTGRRGTGVENLNNLVSDYSWSVAGKSDDGFGSFTAGAHGALSGIWETGLNGFGAFSVKASPGYMLFKTDDISTINWSTLGLLNGGGNQPGLSHLTLYTGECLISNCGTTPPVVPPVPPVEPPVTPPVIPPVTPPTTPPEAVPTPAAVLPILGGLFGAASRRKSDESENA